MHWFYQLLLVYIVSAGITGILLVAQGESFRLLGNLLILSALSFHWRDRPFMVLIVSLGIAVVLRPAFWSKNFRWKQSLYTTVAISFVIATAALMQLLHLAVPPAEYQAVAEIKGSS